MLGNRHPVSLFYRLERQLRRRLERLAPSWMVTRFTRNGLNRSALKDQRISERLARFSAAVPFSSVDFPSQFNQIPGSRDLLTRRADKICNHHFDLLGSGIVEFGEAIPWHQDFVTQFEWDASLLYSKVRGTTPPGTDIKRPWELSRCQHLITLGLAWNTTGHEKYKQEYISQLMDWIEQNPVGYGVNWVCPMDVAFRAVNWLSAFALMKDGLLGDDTKEFRTRLTTSLWEHGRFIRSHLEWNGPCAPMRANHFLSDLTGLYGLGCFFKDTRIGKQWLRFAHRHLEKEMQHQVLPDGVHFECSMGYHRMCLEIVLWCHSVGASYGCTFRGAYKEKFHRMREYVHAYIRPDNMAPLMGDNDDGRLLSSGLVPLNDHRYLCGMVDNDISSVDALLLSGDQPPVSETMKGWVNFKQGGFHVYRDDDIYLMVRAGALAHNGAHAHCDQLSFELCLHGEPIFVDRGAYVYTSDLEMRNKYRGTQAHNTLMINGAEQNRQSGIAFGYHDDTQTELIRMESDGLEAQHRGFSVSVRPGLMHKRCFDVVGHGAIHVVDTISGAQRGDRLVWHFHLAPGLDAVVKSCVVDIRKGTKNVCVMEISTPVEIRKERFDHSPSYGVLQEAYVLIFEMDVSSTKDSCSVNFRIQG